MKENKELLRELCLAKSPSGYEREVTEIWDSWCAKIPQARHEFTDRNFNSVWSIGSGPIKILLSAHSDEISARVSWISDEGLISIINVGGMDRKVVYGGKVLILSDTGWLEGIVCHKPIHLQEDSEYNSSDPFKDLKVDIGKKSKEEIEALGIYPGSPVVNRRDVDMDFGETGLYGNALDDKSCIYINYEILRKLGEDLEKTLVDGKDSWCSKYTVYVAICGCEETGTENAKILAQRLNPDISIDSDVTFDSSHDDMKAEENGESKASKGCVIMTGPDKSLRLVKLLRDIAKSHEIPFQMQASRAGGTNTRSFKNYSLDCETALVSIPLANMHQIYELADWNDISGAVQLIYDTIISCEL